MIATEINLTHNFNSKISKILSSAPFGIQYLLYS